MFEQVRHTIGLPVETGYKAGSWLMKELLANVIEADETSLPPPVSRPTTDSDQTSEVGAARANKLAAEQQTEDRERTHEVAARSGLSVECVETLDALGIGVGHFKRIRQQATDVEARIVDPMG
jgi:hypothetical protein